MLPVLFLLGCGDAASTVAVEASFRQVITNAPLDGVELCVFGRQDAPCGQSDQTGRVVLPEVPANSEVIFSIGKDLYWPALTNIVTGEVDMTMPNSFPLVLTAIVEAGMAAIGLSADPAKGHVVVDVGDRSFYDPEAKPLAGATLELSPGAGGTPVFKDVDGSNSKDLKATTDRGGAAFINVAPGDWQVKVVHPSRHCRAEWAFPAEAADTYRVKVVPGRNTTIFVYCD